MRDEISRREIIGGIGALGALGVLSGALPTEAVASSLPSHGSVNLLELPALPYPEDALEPVIDKETVKIYHDKHFAAYVAGLNKTLKDIEKARNTGDFEHIKAMSRDLAFNASGVILHWIYFSGIGPNAGGVPTGKVENSKSVISAPSKPSGNSSPQRLKMWRLPVGEFSHGTLSVKNYPF